MNEFKVNVFFKQDTSSFQSIMNELFLIFIKKNIDTTCNDNNEKLIYS